MNLMHVKVLVAKSRPSLSKPLVAHQAPLSMQFSRQEYWSGYPQGIFPIQGLNPGLLIAGGLFMISATRETQFNA